MKTNTIIEGDCLEKLKEIPNNSIDAIITDPPYLLEFMNKEWDRVNVIDPSFGNWLAGFVDGEGCFRIHKVRGGDYYETYFSIKIRRDDRAILEKIQSVLGFGRIQDNKPEGNSKPTSLYIINKRDDCFKLSEVFFRFQLRAKKQRDFFKWYEALLNWKFQKREDRWHGKPNVSAMERNWKELKQIREYKENPIPINRQEFFHYLWAKECLRVLKPGGFLLSFGGTRTYHRMACGIEDAGFEIRDTIMWLYGSGFPKSYNIGKGIQKLKTQGNASWNGTADPNNKPLGYSKLQYEQGYRPNDYSGNNQNNIKEELCQEAKEWEGWGTALKPAVEPIVVARKPLSEKNVALNVLKWGVAGLNIDAGRIEYNGKVKTTQRKSEGYEGYAKRTGGKSFQGMRAMNMATPTSKGRFPANVILDEEAGKMLDEQSGNSVSRKQLMGTGIENVKRANIYGKYMDIKSIRGHNDKGGASRFFYCAKASKSERNFGLKEFKKKIENDGRDKKLASGNMPQNRSNNPKQNYHPTVKPIKLMEYLIKLVSRKDAMILDPFLGSGTTAIACLKLNRRFIGIEKEPEYIKIAKARIRPYLEQTKL